MYLSDERQVKFLVG